MRPGLTCFVVLLLGATVPARAQTPPITPDPERFRPLSYADLRDARPENGTFREIWGDALARNNGFYEERGDLRYVGDVAPATEAHFIVWAPDRSVVLSVLNAASACERHAVGAGAVVKLCPLRVAFYANGRKRITAGPRVCFLELADPGRAKAEPYRSVAFAGFDPRAKAIRIGMRVDHRTLDECSFDIPLDEIGTLAVSGERQ